MHANLGHGASTESRFSHYVSAATVWNGEAIDTRVRSLGSLDSGLSSKTPLNA